MIRRTSSVMFGKGIFVIFFFMFFIDLLFCDKFLFGDYYIEGKIEAIESGRIYFYTKDGYFYGNLFNLKSLTMDSCFAFQNLNDISLYLKSGIVINGKLLNINNYAFYIVKSNKIVKIDYLSISNIKYIGNSNFLNNKHKFKKIEFLDGNIISNLYKVLSDSKIDRIDINFDDENFYEKIWEYFGLYLSKKKMKMLWDLIDIYYDREIILKISDSEILKMFNIEKRNIRKEFIERLIRIILI